MGSIFEALSERFDLPPEATAGAARITLSGRQQVFIEHHKGLLAYSDNTVEVNCGSIRCRIRGEGLMLRAMTAETLLVTGTVFCVETEGGDGRI